MIRNIYHIAVREVGLLFHNPMYIFCMIVFPILTVVFFTSLMNEGQPLEMPVGVVDLDNTSTTRTLIRKLDAFQTTKIVGHYPNMNAASKGIQKNEIYAFIYFPKHTTDDLIAGKQPKMSFYYSDVCITGGSLLFRDLKTVCTLGSAGVGAAKLSAIGKTEREVMAFLQPIAIDLHPIGNPEVNYNVYLSNSLVPACIFLLVFLVTAYSIGTELKFNRSKEWIAMADNNIFVAIAGKMLPQFLIFLSIVYGFMFYVYYILGFPHPGGLSSILILGFLGVVASQGFGIFIFGLVPSLRMSMSICSLWASVSFSIMGATYPVSAMNPEIIALSDLFPMRHFFMIYQICIFNGYSFHYAWTNIAALIIFSCLPLLVLNRIKKAMLTYVYMP